MTDSGSKRVLGRLQSLFRGLAWLELHHARSLCWEIVEAPSLEKHVEIGLAIGKAGRRLRLLTEEADHTDKTLQPIDDALLRSAPELFTAYGAADKAVAATGLTGFSFALALKQCRGLLDNGAQAQTGAMDRVQEWLLEAGAEPSDRVKSVPQKARIGNPDQKFDPRFRFLPEGEVLPRVRRIESADGLRHKLHYTVFRETLAAELAALNLYEFDGLPWRFYVDMCRQVEDESRHAMMAHELLLKKGGDLSEFPVCYLGNFYMMNLSMSLDERLVAMNLDTEAIGQHHLRDMAERLFSIGETEAAEMFEVVEVDEARHAQIGARWFRHLCPQSGQRKARLEEARSFAIAHLAVSHCEITGESSAANVITRWINGSRSFALEPFDAEIHEQEVSLTTASERAYHHAL